MTAIDSSESGFGFLTGDDLWYSEPPTVRVWEPNREAVVLGRGGNPERDCFTQACLEDRIPLLRRTTGGGAVFLSPGVLCMGILLHRTFLDPHRYYRPILHAIQTALEPVTGPGLSIRGISDLAMDEKKILGATLAIRRQGVLFLASLLLTDLRGRAERYLKIPARQPDYRAGRSHTGFLIDWDLRDRKEQVRTVLTHALNRLAHAPFTDERTPAEVENPEPVERVAVPDA